MYALLQHASGQCRRSASIPLSIDSALTAQPTSSELSQLGMAHPARFERATSAFGGQRSIQLSYGCSRRTAGAHHRQAGRRRQWVRGHGSEDLGLRIGAPARCICQAPDHRAVHGPRAAGGEWRNAMRDLPASRVRRPERCARHAGASCGVPGRASRRRQPCRRGPRAPCRGGSASSSLVSPCLTLSRLVSAYLA